MSNIINYIFDILNQNIYFKLLGIISFIFTIYEIVKFICNKISEQIVSTFLQYLSKKCFIKSKSGIIEINNLNGFSNKNGFDFILKYKDGKISNNQVYIPKIKIGDVIKMTILSIYRYEKLVKQELNGTRDVHCHVCSPNGYDDFYLTSKREFKVINYNIEK